MSQPQVTCVNNIVFGGLIKVRHTKDATSIGEFCLERLKEMGDHVALVDGVTGVQITAAKLRETAISFAQNLRALGVKENETVGLCCENRLEYAYTIYGTMMINATLAPMNLSYTDRELDHAIKLSRPKIIFCSNATIKNVAKVAQMNAFVKNVVNFDDTTPSRFIMPYTMFLKSLKEKPKRDFKVNKASEDNVVLILCSSGTTGLPKGVQLTQKNLLHAANCQFESRAKFAGLTLLSVIPWFHVYGCVSTVLATLIGARIVFLPKFQSKLFLHCIQHYKVDVVYMVPPLMVFLAKHPMVEKYDLSSLKFLLCGAAPLGDETVQAVKKRINVPLIRQGYGMSETTTGIMVQKDGHEKPGSVGTIAAGVYAKIIDPETGKTLGPNQRGELCFKGNHVMKGYIGDTAATAQTIDSEGWLHTGDIAYYDEDFDFYIVDRLKELIKYKGFQVPPAELEALLLTNPNIKDAAVIGVPDEASGELPMAFVVKQAGIADLSEKEVVEFVAQYVSPAKQLHGGVRFIDEIPKNEAGKILRRLLRDMVSKDIKSKL